MKSIFVVWCFSVALSGFAHAGDVLIRPEEAALPPSTGAPKTLVTRALTRRPDLELVSPEKPVTSPFKLKLKFQAHGGSQIRPDSFQLTYLKNPPVDLTPRVRPYLSAQGVEVSEAEAPVGRHAIEARISDSDGRETSTVFVLNLIK